MRNRILQLVFLGIILALLQMLLFSKLIVLSGVVALPYILLILRLPYRYPASLLLLIAFVYGILIDLMLGTGGVHTSATLALAIVRKPILLALVGKDAESEGHPSSARKSVGWFLIYASICSGIHQLWFLSVETMFNVSFWYFISRFILSAIITILSVVILDNIIESPQRKRY